MNSEHGGIDDPLDVSPLDPAPDEEALARLARRIRTAATAELVRRQAAIGVGGMIIRLRGLILAASGALAVASVLVLATVERPATSMEGSVIEALGVPSAFAPWVYGTDRPTPGELLAPEESMR